MVGEQVRTTFLDAARTMAALIRHPAVAAAWDAPSALGRMTVGDLAAHVARAGLTVQVYLDATPEDVDPAGEVDAPGYYLAFSGLTDVDSALSAGVRERAREGAADGPAAVADRTDRTVDELARVLPGLPTDRRIAVKDGIVLPLDEYLRTRLVELAVHTDDLLASVPGLAEDLSEAATLPEAARDEAIDVLVGLAVRRHGRAAVLTALTRRERDGVQALRVL